MASKCGLHNCALGIATAATLARKEHISVRVAELQEEQLAIHKQATVEAVANAKVTIESLIAEAEAARAKAEKGGAAAAVSALTAKANLDPRRIKPGGSSRLHGEPMAVRCIALMVL
jgi:hypothetical protein